MNNKYLIILISIQIFIIAGCNVNIHSFTSTPAYTPTPVIIPYIFQGEFSLKKIFPCPEKEEITHIGPLLVDREDNLYISEFEYSRSIYKLDSTGRILKKWTFDDKEKIIKQCKIEEYMVHITEKMLKKLPPLYADRLKDLINKKINKTDLINELRKRDITYDVINVILYYPNEKSKEKFSGLLEIDVRGNMYTYIATEFYYIIQKYDLNGKFIWEIKSNEDDRDYHHVYAIKTDFEGNLYVSHGDNFSYGSKIHKFNSNGKVIKYWRWPNDYCYLTLQSMKFDSNGYMYVAETICQDMNEPSSCGALIYKLKLNQSLNVKKLDKVIKVWGSAEQGHREIFGMPDIAINPKGNILVSDGRENQIQIFDPNNNFISKFGSKGSGNGQFDRPRYMAVDSKGNLYVVDTGNYRIQKFKPNPDFK